MGKPASLCRTRKNSRELSTSILPEYLRFMAASIPCLLMNNRRGFASQYSGVAEWNMANHIKPR